MGRRSNFRKERENTLNQLVGKCRPTPFNKLKNFKLLPRRDGVLGLKSTLIIKDEIYVETPN